MVTAVVPARDECQRVARTVRALLAVADEVVVVDDGSRDTTASAAVAAGATVLRLPNAFGKAGAVLRGAALALGDVLVFCDADLGESARCFETLLRPVLYGRTAMTVGLLPATGKHGGLGGAVGLARWGVRRLTGLELTAPLSGQRVLLRRALRHLRPVAGFGLEVALTVDLARAGYRPLEIPTEIRHRVGGFSATDVTHRGRQLLDVALALRARW